MQTYNFAELLQIAKKIETNGRKFYLGAAKICPQHESLFLELASQELEHEKFYGELYLELESSFDDADLNDPSNQILPYLHSIADNIVFELAKNPEDSFTGGETIEQLLEMASSREQDAILFFTGIKDAVENPTTKVKIEKIIAEEMRHLTWLRQRKMLLNGSVIDESVNKIYDLIIIGAGPGGIALAAEAISNGINRDNILLLESADKNSWMMRKLYPDQKLVTANFKGEAGDCFGVMKMRNMTKSDALTMLSETIGDYGIRIVYEQAVNRVEKDNGTFVIHGKKSKFQARNCAVAIGVFGKPRKPDYKIPLEIRKKTLFDITSDIVEDQSVLVVGGGDSASEYVQYLLKANNRMSLSCRENLTYMNDNNREITKSLTRKGSLNLYVDTNIESLEAGDDDKIRVIFKDNNPEPLYFDRIVYALGGTTPINFLKVCGIDFDKKFPILSDGYETTIPGLYLVGDLAAPKMCGAIATAFNSAHYAMKDMLASGKLQGSVTV